MVIYTEGSHLPPADTGPLLKAVRTLPMSCFSWLVSLPGVVGEEAQEQWVFLFLINTQPVFKVAHLAHIYQSPRDGESSCAELDGCGVGPKLGSGPKCNVRVTQGEHSLLCMLDPSSQVDSSSLPAPAARAWLTQS